MLFNKRERIGQLLLQKKLVTAEHLEQASLEQGKSGSLLGSILVKLGVISEEELYRVLSEQFGIEYIKLKDVNISHSIIRHVPARFATYYTLIPIHVEKDRNVITVATSNPANLHALDDLKFLSGKDVMPVISSENEIVEAIRKYYGLGAEAIGDILPEAPGERIISLQGYTTEDIVRPSEDGSIVRFVNRIILEAYKDRATDIHIEPYEDELRIRYRIDGILYDIKLPPNIRDFHGAIVSRIKIMASLDIAERRLPQDGRIKVKIGNDEIDLRVSLLPCPFGESIVIRLLSTNILYGLDKLGFLKKDLEIFQKLINKPYGIIFVTGPTGSGKTTTLYAALSSINSEEKKIVTIEDPIEYQLKGIVQTQIRPRISLTFSRGLRSILRHDPDIVMVGEVRDYEAAEITIRVALTGHIVFSTIHTNDAATAAIRLIDMGVEPFLIASSVNAFLAQRLIRLLCPHCKMQARIDEELLKKLRVEGMDLSTIKIYEPRGCELCKYTGHHGRTAIYEVLVLTEPIRKLILERASAEQIREKAVSLGMHTLRQDGLEKVFKGITTLAEVMRVTQQEEMVEEKNKVISTY